MRAISCNGVSTDAAALQHHVQKEIACTRCHHDFVHLHLQRHICKRPSNSMNTPHKTAVPAVLSPTLTLLNTLPVWLAQSSKGAALPAKVCSRGIVELHGNTQDVEA